MTSPGPSTGSRTDTTGDLVQVTALHFCAALVIREGVCVRAAPILKWAIGWKEPELRIYFKRKGWKAIRVASSAATSSLLGEATGRPNG